MPLLHRQQPVPAIEMIIVKIDENASIGTISVPVPLQCYRAAAYEKKNGPEDIIHGPQHFQE